MKRTKNEFTERKVTVVDDGEVIARFTFNWTQADSCEVTTELVKDADRDAIRRLLFACVDNIGYTLWTQHQPWNRNGKDKDFQEDFPF